MTTVDAHTVSLPSTAPVEARTAPHHRSRGMSIVLIDRQPWTRQCLSQWFQQGSSDLRVVATGSAAELIDLSGSVEDLHLILLSIVGASIREPEVLGQIRWLRQHMPQVPLVLLAGRNDLDDVVEAMAHGVQGFITTSMELSEAAAGIECVAGDGTFVPASALVKFALQQPNGARSIAGAAMRCRSKALLHARAKSLPVWDKASRTGSSHKSSRSGRAPSRGLSDES
jgi:DNA-binding NarL/FixJ family response regulator